MKNTRLGFKKLLIGLTVILTIALISALASSVIINSTSKQIRHVNNNIYPFMDDLKELKQTVLNSKMLITNWVYLQYNMEDKEELKKLIQTDYPLIKQKILSSIEEAGHRDNTDTLNLIFEKMDTLLSVEKRLMKTLVTFDDYENPQKVFVAEAIIEDEIIPQSKEIRNMLNRFITHVESDSKIIRDDMLSSLSFLELTVIAVGFGMFFIILLSLFYIRKQITNPILSVHTVLLKLTKGEIITEKIKATDNIITNIIQALNTLSNNFATVANEAHQIGQGNFDTPIQPLSKKDILGNAIIEMRNSLKEYSEEMEEKVKIRTAKISKQNEIINKKNEDITASINYAFRIQSASLPNLNEIQSQLTDSFILLRPKGIVSGDFYWFTKIENKIIIAAVDCTGHGVPGGFMSLIGIQSLSEIVNQNKITEPDLILEHLNEKVHKILKQDSTNNQDGMDMALCVIDKTKKELYFAGAKNPLIYIQNNKIVKIKGDKKSIGGKQWVSEKHKKHTVKFDVSTSFYIFSDGYQDQFGGKNNRKFMVKNMQKIFLENHNLPMEKQKTIYIETLNNWMKTTQQVDDILIIGFKL